MGNKINLDNPTPADVRLVQQTNRQFAMSFVQNNADLNEQRGLFHDFFQPNLLDKIRLKKTTRKELPFVVINDSQAFPLEGFLEFRIRNRVPVKVAILFDCFFKKDKNGEAVLVQKRPKDAQEFVVEEPNPSMGITLKVPGHLKEFASKATRKRTNSFPILISMKALRPPKEGVVEVYYAVRRLEGTQELKVVEEYVLRNDKLFVVSDVFSVAYEGGHTDKNSVSRGSTVDEDTCIFCFSDKVTCLLTPCRHMSLCFECSKRLQSTTNKCPICRETIREIVRVEIKPRAIEQK
jgi:hypothetical protein